MKYTKIKKNKIKCRRKSSLLDTLTPRALATHELNKNLKGGRRPTKPLGIRAVADPVNFLGPLFWPDPVRSGKIVITRIFYK